MGCTRVIVVDDHDLIRSGVCSLLEEAPDIEVVAETGEGPEVLAIVRRLRPAVVLLDLRLGAFDTLGCIRELRVEHPDVRVIVFSAETERPTIQAALEAGADSYVVKSVVPSDLAAVIRQAMADCVFRPLAVLSPGLDDDPTAALSKRERTILTTVARGLSNGQIARELWITEPTVKFHLRNIYRKLGVSNRTEATRLAFRVDGSLQVLS